MPAGQRRPSQAANAPAARPSCCGCLLLRERCQGTCLGRAYTPGSRAVQGLAAAGSTHPHACTAGTSGTQQLPASCLQRTVPSTWQEAAASAGPLGEALLAPVTLVIQPWLSGSAEGRAVTPRRGNRQRPMMLRAEGSPYRLSPAGLCPRGLGSYHSMAEGNRSTLSSQQQPNLGSSRVQVCS